jgi:predicted nucleic acid-binding Zn ribbon protein
VSGARPERLGDLLRGYLAGSGLEERLAEAEVVPDWAARVGPAIAAVTSPLRVTRGSLVVAVRSSAWLMELQMMERHIRQAVNEGRQRGRIEKIRFVMADGEESQSGMKRKS